VEEETPPAVEEDTPPAQDTSTDSTADEASDESTEFDEDWDYYNYGTQRDGSFMVSGRGMANHNAYAGVERRPNGDYHYHEYGQYAFNRRVGNRIVWENPEHSEQLSHFNVVESSGDEMPELELANEGADFDGNDVVDLGPNVDTDPEGGEEDYTDVANDGPDFDENVNVYLGPIVNAADPDGGAEQPSLSDRIAVEDAEQDRIAVEDAEEETPPVVEDPGHLEQEQPEQEQREQEQPEQEQPEQEQREQEQREQEQPEQEQRSDDNYPSV